MEPTAFPAVTGCTPVKIWLLRLVGEDQSRGGVRGRENSGERSSSSAERRFQSNSPSETRRSSFREIGGVDATQDD